MVYFYFPINSFVPLKRIAYPEQAPGQAQKSQGALKRKYFKISPAFLQKEKKLVERTPIGSIYDCYRLAPPRPGAGATRCFYKAHRHSGPGSYGLKDNELIINKLGWEAGLPAYTILRLQA